MKSERFFHFIHSLTRNQKAAFTRLNRSRTKFLDMELYNRILGERAFSKETDKRIRKGKFENAGQYFYYRIKLGRKILHCLVLLDEKEPTSCGLIRQAAKMGVGELANSIASVEIKDLLKTEDFLSLSHLLETCRELSYKYRTLFELPDDTPSLQYLNQRKRSIENLRQIIVEVKKSLLLSDEKKFAVVQNLRNKLDKISPQSHSEEFLWHRAMVSNAILNKDYHHAYQLQEELISLKAWGLAINSEVIMVTELFQRIILAAIIGCRDKALANLSHLRNLKLKSRSGKTSLDKQLAIHHIDLGEKYGNTEFTTWGIALVEEKRSLFSNHELVRLYLLAGLTQFYNSNYKEALSCIEVVYEFHSKFRTVIIWEPEALEALIHLEMGSIDEFDECIERAGKQAKKAKKQYPILVVNTIKQISHLSISEKPAFLRASLVEIENTKARIEEAQVSRYWDFSRWIKTQLSFNSYIDLINAEVNIEKQRYKKTSS